MNQLVKTNMFDPSKLPDVATHHVAEIQKTLQWVGMEDIAIPVCYVLQDGRQQHLSAKSSLYVSLDDQQAKGIHMSRLHLALNDKLAGQELDLEKVGSLLEGMVSSQEGISENGRLTLEFELVLEKKALLSDEYAFQSYPVKIDAQYLRGELAVQVDLTVPYSSTCPCSASLSRQLFAEAISEQFSSQQTNKEQLIDWVISKAGSVATPHSQRSYAYISLNLTDQSWPKLDQLIFQFEQVIGTPVQTAVKRSDEQAFARLNAENLMFCEDAARRIKSALEGMAFVSDYCFKVEHQESLHAHNAVVIDQKFPTNPIMRDQ